MTTAQKPGQQQLAAPYRSLDRGTALARRIIGNHALVPLELLPSDVALVLIFEQNIAVVRGGSPDALAELERTEQRWYEAEMHRIRTEILLKRDPANTTAAEQSLQAAIAIAQSAKARSFELRAALSLANLYRSANRDADAHAVLAPAVEGFPPALHIPELAETQTLRAALRS